MHLRYRYRLYPTAVQAKALSGIFGCARVVYNDGLSIRKEAFAAGLPYVSNGELSARLTASKRTPERAWLADAPAAVLQQALRDLNAAYDAYFASKRGTRPGPKVNLPRFRSRKDHRQAVRFTANTKFKVLTNGRLRLSRVGDVKVRWSRPLPAKPSSVTIIKEGSGRFIATFVVDVPTQPLPKAKSVVGIDLGLKDFAVLSDGRKVAAPRLLRRAEGHLKHVQRQMDRKKPGSKNREKARVRLARAHAHVVDARRDFHHKLSTQLIRENQAVAVEDLSLRAFMRTRMGKSVRDAGWGTFIRMLRYKAELYGREFHQIGRYEPTSQTCSACGVRDGKKPLRTRVWRCPSCGTMLDRDINAAVNVAKAAGLAVTACGGDVRPGSVPAIAVEAGTLRGAA